MKTYSRGNTTAKKSARYVWARYKSVIISAITLVLISVALTLALIFGIDKKQPVTDMEVEVPVVSEPKLEFNAPLKELTVIKSASIDKIVWSETLKQFCTHEGVDFKATVGESVNSMAQGKVLAVQDTILDGVVVTIEHADGFTSVYKGLSNASVSIGDEVTASTVIGTVGNIACESSSGAHLHVELIKSGLKVNVTDYLDVESK